MDLKDLIRLAAGRKHSHRYTLPGPNDGWKGLSKVLRRVLIALVAVTFVIVVLIAIGIALLVTNFDTVRGWFASAGQTAVQQVEDWSTQWPEQKQRALEYVESLIPATKPAETPATPAQTAPTVPAEAPAALPDEPVERPEG